MTVVTSYIDLFKKIKRISGKSFYWYLQGDVFNIQTKRKKYRFYLDVSELEAIFIIDSAIKFLRTKMPEQLTMFCQEESLQTKPPTAAEISNTVDKLAKPKIEQLSKLIDPALSIFNTAFPEHNSQ